MNTFNASQAKELSENLHNSFQEAQESLLKQELEDKPHYFAQKLVDFFLNKVEKLAAAGCKQAIFHWSFNKQTTVEKASQINFEFCKIMRDKQFNQRSNSFAFDKSGNSNNYMMAQFTW